MAIPSPDEPESLKRPFNLEKALDVAHSRVKNLRDALYLAVAQVVCVFSLEGLLNYLILLPDLHRRGV